MKRFCGILMLCLIIGLGQSQNLVPNPSFEANSGIPTCMDQFYWCNRWYNATSNTPDYIHALASNDEGETGCTLVNTLSNWLGSQSPHSGQAYAALHTYVSNAKHREYIGVKLLEPMQKGRAYEVKMYVSKAERTAYDSNFGMLFTLYEEKTSSEIENEQALNIPDIVTITNGWYEFKTIFVADTNYQYLTLGNFFEYDDPKFKLDGPTDPNKISNLASYYFDDISVTPLPLQKPDLGGDRVICSNASTTFSSNVTAHSYMWNTGETSSSITVSEPGEYILCINSFGETKCDTVNLGNIPAPDIELGEDIAVCPQDSFEITVNIKPFSGAWSTGNSGQEITVSNYGAYYVTVTNETNCRDEDSITIYEKCPDCLDELNINPNPISDILNFKVLYDTNNICSYYIIDIKGRIVIRQEDSFSSGYNYRNLDCNNLQSGNYVLVVEGKCGRVSKVFQKL